MTELKIDCRAVYKILNKIGEEAITKLLNLQIIEDGELMKMQAYVDILGNLLKILPSI